MNIKNCNNSLKLRYNDKIAERNNYTIQYIRLYSKIFVLTISECLKL